jgi:hypothetical protein
MKITRIIPIGEISDGQFCRLHLEWCRAAVAELPPKWFGFPRSYSWDEILTACDYELDRRFGKTKRSRPSELRALLSAGCN